ncbi:MAG: hypothetical protein WA118_08320 [Carboxydocellales bacterium]
MSKLTDDMIQRRLETVSSGSYTPAIPGLDGLVFVKMGLAERGVSARAYSSRLKELYALGGYFSQALIPFTLAKICKDNGLDMKVLDKNREILKRFYDSIPAELAAPLDGLTDEEVQELSPEGIELRDKALEERGVKMFEYMQTFYTDEDRQVMDLAKQIEQLETHIKNNTAEHLAWMHQMDTEILISSKKAEDTGSPYFSSIDEIKELEYTNREGLVHLYLKWKQFKEGLLPEFFRPDNSIQ